MPSQKDVAILIAPQIEPLQCNGPIHGAIIKHHGATSIRDGVFHFKIIQTKRIEGLPPCLITFAGKSSSC